MTWLLGACLIVFLLTLAGGVVPFLLRDSDRVKHLTIAFAAGIFLGAVFLHLLPEISTLASGEDGMFVWLFVLLGVLLLFLLENLVFAARPAPNGEGAPSGNGERPDGFRRHRAIGYATVFGLSVHAFTSGLGLSVGVELETLKGPLLLSIVSHKAAEGFSLCAALLLSQMPRRRTVLWLLAFSLLTPAGALIRTSFATDVSGLGLQVLSAFAAGTFLFVALCDLLPEVFHHRHDTLAKIGLLAAGIGTSILVHMIEV